MKSTAGGELKKELRNERGEENDSGRTPRMCFHSSRHLGGELVGRSAHVSQTLEKAMEAVSGPFSSPHLASEETQPSVLRVSPELTSQHPLSSNQATLPGAPGCLSVWEATWGIRCTWILSPLATNLEMGQKVLWNIEAQILI